MKEFVKKKIGPFNVLLLIIFGSILVIGIIVGSFLDLEISKAIVNPKNPFGMFLDNFGQIFGFIMLSCGASLICSSFLRDYKNNKLGFFLSLAFVLVVVFVSPLGGYQTAYGKDGWGFQLNKIGAYIIIVIINVIGFLLGFFFIDRKIPRRNLIIAGCTILFVAAFTIGLVNLFLKQLAYRPRYRTLVFDNEVNHTTAIGLQYYRNWWQFSFFKNPLKEFNLPNDYSKSWPSGHSSCVSIAICYPLFVNNTTIKGKYKNEISFILGALLSFMVMFSRILVGAHYLSDVCFGTLVTFIGLIIALFVFKYHKNSVLTQTQNTSDARVDA